MRTNQLIWENNQWKGQINTNSGFTEEPDLTLIFGDRIQLESQNLWQECKSKFDGGDIVTCSTAGSILGQEIYDNQLTATSIKFDSSSAKCLSFSIENKNSYDLGKEIANVFKEDLDSLKLLYLISDGHSVNGSQLVVGVNEILEGKVPVTGGLAGDEARFEKTLVGLNQAPAENRVIAIGFSGNSLEVGYGASLGWKPFGPVRKVTKSNNNELLEIDGKPALEIYRSYLGSKAKDLPGSALLFPLKVTPPGSAESVVRTPLGVDEGINSLTCAGDILEGSTVQFMTSNFESLIEEAGTAAGRAQEVMNVSEKAQLALMVSCVGRRLVLGQLAEDEVEEASEVFGSNTAVAGFYSYGEICPSETDPNCLLQNETMTITSLREI